MIRLTLNAHSNPEIHLFNKSTIFIGSDANHADLILSHPHIQSIHLKIIEQNGHPFLINYVNDPFVTLNDNAFGKKLLNSGDVISLHQMTLLFENLPTAPPNLSDSVKEEGSVSPLVNEIDQPDNAQSTLLTPLAEGADFTSFSFPFEGEVKGLGEEELQQTSLDDYLKGLESLSQPSIAPNPPSPKEQVDRKKATASLKDDYLRDLEDDNYTQGQGPFGNNKEPSHLYQAWKWILLFIFSLIAISGVVGTVIYFTVSDKAEAQETKAAQGMADIAMALTHAHLNHLKPHNHNWSDVDFLKSNLQAILPDSASYAAQIDAQGQFNCCPYSLRIYTNSDLSHFLLIAQPAPSLLNWLIPQSLIVVDSHLMELRILKDVRSLNRLLANPEPLDGPSGKEITLLIKQSGLLRLAALAADSGQDDFFPPKNLAWIKPGAENFIYNAPRYYRLGQHIIQKATALATSKGSSQEVAALKQDVEDLSWLHSFTLYADQGKKSAMLVRQGLMLFAPSDKVLFGYLLLNSQGKIEEGHLLKDEEEMKESTLVNVPKEGDLVAFQASVEKEENNKKNLEKVGVDMNHPIYIQLQSLISNRETELKPLAISLNNMVNQELLMPRAQFQVEFQNLSHTYLLANAKHKQAIKETIDSLYQKYEEIPIHQFLSFIKALNLEQMIQQEDNTISVIDENCQQNMELLLTYIENSKSLVELDNLIHIASTWLNFDYIKEPNELMKYQNLLRNQLLEQLERYLLSQKKHFIIKADDKEILQHILSQERLIKPEEKEFFLEEFDEIVALQQTEEASEEEKE